ncbi:MAG TPA: iron ABC transporter permease [Bacteroidales bacterium]|jgi:iron complex transport system permease protein|nr:iron ABC transporter permease [Bacteroidales bacterium]HNX83194.1 iron ABC transporter permease [Bacteroidales bacterium]HOC47433.1 iron ABC transporter permease [Bacteroidales bacterium]HPS96683.1 iron ABC transporter permease [Bacteroidales bacterium]
MREGSTRIAVSMAGLFLLTLILFMADMLIGSTQMAASDVLKALFSSGPAGDEIIVMQFRLPKALTAVLAGAAMSVSGLLMQTLFRNPLAGPDVMGVSSGAGLGVALTLLTLTPLFTLAEGSILAGWGVILAAWAGAGAVMIIIMAVSARMRDIMTVLIVGMLLASAISAVVSLMQYFSNEVMLRTYVIWTMGNLGNISYPQIRALALATAAGLAIAFTMVKPLNAILMGETFSRTVGVRMQRTRIILLASASILAGSVTAFCGPLAFIGVAVPHIARLLFGTADHRILMPATALTGAVILLLSDIISVMPGGGHVIPVNTVTSLIGIPVVLWIILGKAGLGRRF